MNYLLSGINMSDYLPPYNLGPAAHYHYITKVYSEIWGIDPETGKPKEFDVPIDLAFLGQWAFLYIGECIQPVAPLKIFDTNQLISLAPSDHIWMWDGPISVSPLQWDNDEMTGFPDRIHFKYTLPKELMAADVGAREFTIGIQTIDPNPSTGPKWNYETNQTGKLVIADTGAMEIRGNYVFKAYDAVKLQNGEMNKGSLQVHSAEVFDCGTANILYTKNTKKAGYPETGYWVGFRPFCITLYLDSATWGQKVDEGKAEEKDVPTVETPRSYLTRKGRDIDNVAKSMLATNNDPELCLRGTISHYKEILNRYKLYYESLTESEKEAQLAELNAAINTIKTYWPDIINHVKFTDYLPENYVSPQSSGEGSTSTNTEGQESGMTIDDN